jgi:hypothetical protein
MKKPSVKPKGKLSPKPQYLEASQVAAITGTAI